MNTPPSTTYLRIVCPLHFLALAALGASMLSTVSAEPVATSTVFYAKGDPVPGVPGATFTSFGVPAISAELGQVVFLGKWKGPDGNGTGIFDDNGLLAKVGDKILAPGVTIKSVKDPVAAPIAYRTAFLATLQGTGITAASDSVVISNASGDETLEVIAQEGTQAVEAAPGALWNSFSSVALPGNGMTLFLGTMIHGGGGITSENDTGLWCQYLSHETHLVLQKGTTQIGGRTVKNFVVLKTVSGSPGQTHAFNTRAEVVAKVTFTDGAQALVHIELLGTPQG
jgi:hypothetical protein